MSEQEKIYSQVSNQKPNHNLWCNNGTWFIHYTKVLTPYTTQRIRKSLGTKSVREARLKRNELFAKAVIIKNQKRSGLLEL